MVIKIKKEKIIIKEKSSIKNLFGYCLKKIWKATNKNIPILSEL